MTATRHLPVRRSLGEGGTPDTLSIPLKEAAHGKHCLQSALELVKRVRTQLLPGPLADALDQTERQIVVGITVLRDADRVAMGEGVYCREKAQNPQKETRTVTCPKCKASHETSAKQCATCRECGFHWDLDQKPLRPTRTVTCPNCGTPKDTASKAYVQCLNCRFTWQLTAKRPGLTRKGADSCPPATRHPPVRRSLGEGGTPATGGSR